MSRILERISLVSIFSMEYKNMRIEMKTHQKVYIDSVPFGGKIYIFFLFFKLIMIKIDSW